jgi:ligand-binding sensor domain-containing protein
MGNWLDKLAQLPRNPDGSLLPGTVAPVLQSPSSSPGIWYDSPYEFAPDFDLLWVCQSVLDLNVYAFTAAQALVSPESAPHITITLPDPEPSNPNPVKVSAVGFAPNGDMWVGYGNSNPASSNPGRYLSKISASKLTASGPVTPDFSFQISTALNVGTNTVSAIAFAPNGDLWLSTVALTTSSAGIFKYSAASIAGPGSPSPAVVLAQPFPPVPDNPQHTNAANDLRFDSAGNLWFTNALANTVNRLSAAQLSATNIAIVPDIVLSTTLTYTGCALDTLGNLWCARAGRVDMFAASQILASGSPPVARTINTANSAIRVRFDNAGNLWTLAPHGPNGYGQSDIVFSGTPAPRSALTAGGAITSGRMFAFNPQSFA